MSAKILTAVLVFSMLFATGASAFASEASEAVNNFAFNAGKILMDGSDENFFFSPFSIISAFGMSYAGASGDTAREIESALGITQGIHSSLGELTRDLDKGKYLSSANRVWLRNGLSLRRDYSDTLSLCYNSKPCELDMKGHNEESRLEINNWVESKTNGKIKDLIRQLDPETRMVITNAVYFNAEWQKKFPKSATKNEKFFTVGENFSEVPMMKQRDDFMYAEVDGVKVIMLPYKDRRLSMIVALPSQKENADALKNLNAETFASWLESMRKYDVDLWLPKFKTEKRYELNKLFEALGIQLAFTNYADFSGITDDERLKIDAVIHQSFIDVDEDKTEAAAATAMVMLKATAMPEMKPFAEFHADRPFMYFIRDNQTGTILFMGYQSFKDI